MEKNQINFLDENGKPIPLEEVQKAVEKLYTEMTDNCNCCGESILEVITDPENQIDPEKSMEIILSQSSAVFTRRLFIPAFSAPLASVSARSPITRMSFGFSPRVCAILKNGSQAGFKPPRFSAEKRRLFVPSSPTASILSETKA